MVWQIGDSVREVKFIQANGAAMNLAAFAGKPLLLIFLRHLA